MLKFKKISITKKGILQDFIVRKQVPKVQSWGIKFQNLRTGTISKQTQKQINRLKYSVVS